MTLRQHRSNLGLGAFPSLSPARSLCWPCILLAICLSVGSIGGCTTPRPSWQEDAYSKKINSDRSAFYLRQTPPEKLLPDNRIRSLRQSYANDTAADLSAFLLNRFEDNLQASLAFLKKERFKCEENLIIECKSIIKIYPYTLDPFAPLNRKPTHCLDWLVKIEQNNQTIENVKVVAQATLCD